MKKNVEVPTGVGMYEMSDSDSDDDLTFMSYGMSGGISVGMGGLGVASSGRGGNQRL